MNSFNVYGQTEQVVGGNTPVWLGTVKPIPRGASSTARGDYRIPAGTGVIYNASSGVVTVVKDINEAGGTMVSNINAFIYNDVNVENPNGVEIEYTVALVQHHPEGLLIERVYPDITDEQIVALQEAVPGVLLVRG